MGKMAAAWEVIEAMDVVLLLSLQALTEDKSSGSNMCTTPRFSTSQARASVDAECSATRAIGVAHNARSDTFAMVDAPTSPFATVDIPSAEAVMRDDS
ncbi:hypothetical protein MTO96_013853 [Rhipicephalus appendiculatus]